MLVSEPEGMRFPWRFLFDLLSAEHRTPAETEGLCFRTLIVGARPSPGMRPTQTPGPGPVLGYTLPCGAAARSLLMKLSNISVHRRYRWSRSLSARCCVRR